MEFVNSIAKIVHMEVSLHGGSPNKNIGDAFLLVWKLPRGFTSRDIPRPSRTSGWGPPPPPSPGYAPPQEPLGTGPAAAAGPPVSSPVAVLAFAEPTKPGRSPLGAAPPLRSSSGRAAACKAGHHSRLYALATSCSALTNPSCFLFTALAAAVALHPGEPKMQLSHNDADGQHGDM